MEEEEAGTPPRLKVVTAKLCNGEKENSNEVSTLKKPWKKRKKVECSGGRNMGYQDPQIERVNNSG